MNIVRVSAVAAALVCVAAVGPVRATGSETPSGAAASNGDAELFQQARRAESVYRDRLARLRRLRDLGQDEGAGEQLAELDALYKRLHGSRELRIGRIRGKLDAAAHARLDAQLAEGRDRFEWRQEARQQRVDERKAGRQERAEHRQEVRQDRFDQRQANRGERLENRQGERQEHFDQRQANKGERSDTRQGKRQEHFDQRQANKGERSDTRQGKRQEHFDQRQANKGERSDTRQGKRQEHFDQRQANRGERLDSLQAARQEHFEQRQAKRADAETRWQAAREQAFADAQSRRAQRRDAVGQNVARWRDEAGNKVDTGRHRSDRWRKAAQRQGALNDRVLSQREADAAVAAVITRANAKAELQRLRREIESD